MASRSVLFEEGVLEATHGCLIGKQSPPCVGLVIGKREVGARDFVLALVPFPEAWNDEDDGEVAGRPVCKNIKPPAASGAAVVLNREMLLEHVTQVSGMLCGGLSVVGVYCFASDASFKSASPALTRVAIEAKEDCVRLDESHTTKRGVDVEQLIIHLSAENVRKVSVKRARRSVLAHAPAPVEVGFGKVMDSFVAATTSYKCELELVIDSTAVTKKKTIRQYARQVLEHEAARIEKSVVLLENELWHDDTPVSAVPKSNQCVNAEDKNFNVNSGVNDSPFSLRAEFLVPGAALPVDDEVKKTPDGNRTGDVESGNTDVVTVILFGTLTCSAYAYGREPVSRLVDDLKRDVVRSLRARLEFLCDECDADASGAHVLSDDARVGATSTSSTSAKNKIELNLPRRAFAGWTKGLKICDYLLAGETEVDVKQRCSEVWGLTVGVGDVVVAEGKGVGNRGFAGDAKPKIQKEKQTPKEKESDSDSGMRKNLESSPSYVTYVLGAAGAAMLSLGLAGLAMTQNPECVGETCAALAGG